MRLYVENLPGDITEHELYCLFMEFGGIVDVSISRDSNGRSLGTAYVEMKEDEHAHVAIKALRGINFRNNFLLVWEISDGFLL